jgi:hypothetical protein
MKLQSTIDNKAEMSGIASVSAFSIKATAKSFAILSSGLYTNKIRAVVRELSCNAYDSHVAANKKDVPFYVHIPTVMQPWFAVRDYGVGLSHDDVVSIYTTYFESTKTESNDYIGALGLGSKSPFSYTDNFTVTAIKNGIKNVYTAFISEEGVPSVALMASSPSDEDTGVEVKMSVNSKDFNSFSGEASIILEAFSVKPDTNVKLNYSKSYLETPIREGFHKATYTRSNNHAVMGNIHYPILIPKDTLDTYIASKNLTDNKHLYTIVDKLGMFIKFDNGDLEFAASREGLSYTKQTIQNILKKYDEFVEHESKRISDILNACKTPWEILVNLHTKLKGDTFTNAVVVSLIRKMANPPVTIVGNGWNLKPVVHVDEILKTECNAIIWSVNSRKRNRENALDSYFIHPDTHFMHVDEPRYKKAKLVDFLEKTNCSYSYVIEPADQSKDIDFKKIKELFYNITDDHFHKQSDYESPKTVGPSSKKNVPQTFLIEKYGFNNVRYIQCDIPDPEKTSNKVYYIPLSALSPVTTTSINLGFNGFIEQINLVGIKLYGIRKDFLKEIKDDPNYINIEDHLKEMAKSIDDDDIGCYYTSNGMINANILKYSSDPAAKQLNEYYNMKQNPIKRNKLEYIKILCENSMIDISKMKKVEASIQGYVNTLNNKYPMIKHVYNRYGGGQIENDIANYIKLVDKQ